MREWIDKFKEWLFGNPFPFIGGPLNGREKRLDWTRNLYRYGDSKERVHIYRFIMLRLSDNTMLNAFVSETLDEKQAVAKYENRPKL